MASKIKVDTLETANGSGSITINNPLGIGTDNVQLYNVGGGSSSLVITADSSATNVLANTLTNITIANGDGTADNTAAIHFAREDTDGAPNYAGASVVAQFKETQVTGQYPKADMAFLTSTSANTAPSEKMRILAAGGLTFNGDTAAANALDDYEEGTWTPTFIGSNGNPTVNYAAQSGKYTKVGNQVTLSLYMVTNSVSGGSSSSNLRIAGLPFNSDGAAGGRFGNFQNWNTALNQSIGAFANGSYMPVFWKQNVAVTTNQLRTSGDSNQMWFDITYRCVG